MKQMTLKDLIYGLVIGAGVLAPGISIATIALVLGIYEKMLGAISDFFSSRFKTALPFLIPFGLGAVLSVGLSSVVISRAYDYFPAQTIAVFLGLIVASIPLLWRTSEATLNFKPNHYVALSVVALVIGALGFLNTEETGYIVDALTVGDGIQLFLTGAFVVSAMLLPGLSGALILLLFGSHSMLVHAISELNLPVLGVTALGGIVGLMAFSKLIKFLMAKYLVMVNAVSIGMVIGSVVNVGADYPEVLSVVGMFAVGYLLIVLLERKKS